MPDLATGAVAPTPAAGSAPALDQSAAGQVPARLDGDALLDGDEIQADQRYHVSAAKFKELQGIKRAFREAGIDPALAPNVIQAALAWVQATRDAEAAGGQPAKPAPTAADDEDTKARAALQALEGKWEECPLCFAGGRVEPDCPRCGGTGLAALEGEKE